MISPIDDDWVAIREFNSELTFETSNEEGWDIKSENIFVEWIELNRTFLINLKHNDINEQVIYSIDSLSAIHSQIKELTSIEIELPNLPYEPKGLWGYLSSSVVPENVEGEVQNYFVSMAKKLGKKMFMELYFNTFTEKEYLENMDELNRVSLLEDVHCAKEILQEAILLRKGSINFTDMLSLYAVEDEALLKLESAEAILYNFERQPFIELREIARGKYRELKKKLETCSEDEKFIISQACLQKMKELKENDTCLIKLQINYFEKCLSALQDAHDRMSEDQIEHKEEFNSSEGYKRLMEKGKELISLKIQLLHLRRKETKVSLDDIKERVCLLSESDEVENKLKHLEKAFHKTELLLYEFQFKVIDEEEKYHRLLLKELQKEANNEDDSYSQTFNEFKCPYEEEKEDEEEEEELYIQEENEEIFHDTSSELSISNHIACAHNLNVDNEKNSDLHASENSDNNHTDDQDEFHDCDTGIGNDTDITNNNIQLFFEHQCVSSNKKASVWESRKHVGKQLSEDFQKKRELLNKINKLYRKRAWLRLKKRKFLSEWKEKVNYKKRAEEEFQKHHSIHLKREKQKKEQEEKSEFLRAERRKTIERLKHYKGKHPDVVTRYPSRYTIPVRRTRNQLKNIPFRPGGPAIIQKGSQASLRIESAEQKKINAKVKVVKTNSNKKSQDNLNTNNETKDTLPDTNISVVETEANTQEEKTPMTPILPPPPPPSLPPPPPPFLPPPPAPPPPPKINETMKILNKNDKSNNSKFPLPPKRQPPANMLQPPAKPAENNSLDLSSIIKGRQMLRKTTTNENKSSKGITDVTALMLQNALDKMKKYTIDSSDDEDEGSMFEENIF